MNRLNKYRAPFWILVVILLALSSTGFTTVLHGCLMPQMLCCEDMAAGNGHAGKSSGGDELRSTLPGCCTVTVAGGLNSNPITVEKNTISQSQKLDLFLAHCVALLPTELLQVEHSSPCTVASLCVDPSPVEKYVLNATFLI